MYGALKDLIEPPAGEERLYGVRTEPERAGARSRIGNYAIDAQHTRGAVLNFGSKDNPTWERPLKYGTNAVCARRVLGDAGSCQEKERFLDKRVSIPSWWRL